MDPILRTAYWILLSTGYLGLSIFVVGAFGIKPIAIGAALTLGWLQLAKLWVEWFGGEDTR